jgi:hypothetical protein
MNVFRVVLFLPVLGALSSFLIQDLGGYDFAPSGVAYAQEDWKNDFDDICGKTQDAMAFSPDELKSLVERCDKLKLLIEKLPETQRKVFLRRLQMCRQLFVFALENKEKS